MNVSMNLYVGNLPYVVSGDDLEEVFASYGEVVSAKVITDRYSGQSKGFGFVEMGDRESGEKAISELNGAELNGRQIKVNEARPRPQGGGRPGGGFGGGRRF